jgi:hypothetical protein
MSALPFKVTILVYSAFHSSATVRVAGTRTALHLLCGTTTESRVVERQRLCVYFVSI